MKQFSKIMLLVLGCGLLGAVLSSFPNKSTEAAAPASVTVVNPASKPVPTTVATHLGVQPSALVALRCNRFVGPTCTEFRRLKPDATEDQVTFQIPNGTHLIITDVYWDTTGGIPGTCTSILMMEAGPGPVVYLASRAPADGVGQAYKAEHFTTGFHFSTMPIFVLVANPGPCVITAQNINVQGYLVNQ